MNKIVISLFLTGLLFGSGPCLASCGPFLTAYIAGTKKNIPKSMITYILFSAARISVYVGLGLVVFFLGRFAAENLLGSAYKYLLLSAGGFIIVIGLLLAFGKKLEFHFWQKNILERDKKSIIAAGLLIGLLPCAPLLTVLAYIGLISRGWLSSVLYSLSFGIGTSVSPLILLTILAGLIPRFFLGKRAVYYPIFSFICGLVIVSLGVQLISRAF